MVTHSLCVCEHVWALTNNTSTSTTTNNNIYGHKILISCVLVSSMTRWALQSIRNISHFTFFAQLGQRQRQSIGILLQIVLCRLCVQLLVRVFLPSCVLFFVQLAKSIDPKQIMANWTEFRRSVCEAVRACWTNSCWRLPIHSSNDSVDCVVCYCVAVVFCEIISISNHKWPSN